MAEKEGNGYSGRDWGFITIGGKRQLICFPSNSETCFVVGLPGELTGGFFSPGEGGDFHDKALQAASAEINTILENVARPHHDSSLHLLLTERGPMLAWVEGKVDTGEV